MKKLIAILVTATLAFAMLSGPAVAKKKKKKAKKATTQEFTGSIALPAPYPAEGSCFFRLERMQALLGLPATGLVGSHFDVDPKTYGQKFALHVTGGSDDVDLDISFYANYGDPADPAGAPANIGFETREPGGEKGVIPEGMTKAIVCMPVGQDAEFHYITPG